MLKVFTVLLVLSFDTSISAQKQGDTTDSKRDSLVEEMLAIGYKYLGEKASEQGYRALLESRLDTLMLKMERRDSLLMTSVLPDVELWTLRRGSLDISLLRGQPSILFFWSVTCQPCLDWIPMINRLSLHYGPKVNILAFTADLPEDVVDYLDLHDFDVVHIADAEHFIEVLDLPSFPRVLVTDRMLNVQGVFGSGFLSISKSEIEQKIRILLDQL